MVVGIGELNIDGEIPVELKVAFLTPTESFYTQHLLELRWDTGNSDYHLARVCSTDKSLYLYAVLDVADPKLPPRKRV